MKRIAIVTPELAGLQANGGIGTNYFFRARFLSRWPQTEVTIFFAGHCPAAAAQAWREQFAGTGVRLEIFPEWPAGADWASRHQRAMIVHRRLAAEAWDEIHFPEYLAHGLVCLQARRSGLAHQKTRLVVTMHSSSRWCRETMQAWSLDPETDARLDYAEQYCCEHADTLISPSRHLMNWAERKGWRLPADRQVLPSLYEILDEKKPNPAPLNPQRLIFFGRLETRKGLQIFCEAIGRLAAAGKAPARVDFLGKVGSHDGKPANQYVRAMSSGWQQTATRILTDLDSFAAMKHIRETGGLAVIASLNDNLPYSVIECVVNHVPFIAANTGGIPELADPRVLFAPDAYSLAAKIGNFPAAAGGDWDHPYKIETVRAAWLRYLRDHQERVDISPPSPPPTVSVCVSGPDLGRNLTEALASLARQTLAHFEVIIVDDGSTDADSNEHFSRLQTEYASPQFRFFKQPNLGFGAARNFAAAQATGELLVFMDADGGAREQMLEIFANALRISGADCATCHYDVFEAHAPALPPAPVPSCAPLGPCLEIGWRENIFGTHVVAVKRKAFETLGGFATDRNGVENWQFLTRAACQGFRQIVIPESLYWHRQPSVTTRSTVQKLRGARAILDAYQNALTSWPAGVMETRVFGPFLRNVAGQGPQLDSYLALNENRRRGKFVRKLQRSCARRLLELAAFVARL